MKLEFVLPPITAVMALVLCGIAYVAADDHMEYMYVYEVRKVPKTDLECLQCYNGDETNDCIELKNISNIPTRICRQGEKFCKVQRTLTNGELTTFDRYCAAECEPGCVDAAIYHECVSCCNHESLCNTDNGGQHNMGGTSRHWFIIFILYNIIFHFNDLV